MAPTTAIRSSTASPVVGEVHPSRIDFSPTILTTIVALAAAWGLTCGLYLFQVAWLLPLVILVGTASLLRAGRTLLDRLVLATGLLVGATCLGGLLFSVWPWGMHPIAVSGIGLTGLVAAAVLTGRRPWLPRPTIGDGLTLAAALLVALAVAWPLIATNTADRLAIVASGADVGQQLALFDTVRQAGGYLFLAGAGAFAGLLAYPEGAHLVYGMLDNFLRSSATGTGTGLESLGHYLGFVVLGYGLLALVVVWSIQWLAVVGLTLPRRVLLIGVALAGLLMTALFRLPLSGYPGQVLGMAAVLMMIALVCRPPARAIEMLVLLSGLIVMVGFVCYLFLPAALFLAAVWLVRSWSTARRYPYALGAFGASAAVAIGAGLVGTVHVSGMPAVFGAPSTGGTAVMMLTVALGVVFVLRPGARRFAIGRSLLWCAVAIGAGFIVVTTFERLSHPFEVEGHVSFAYYGPMSMYLWQAVAVVGLGALLAQRSARPALPSALTRSGRTAMLGVGLAIVVFGGATLGIFGNTALNTAVTNRVTVLPWQWTHGQITDSATSVAVLQGLTAVATHPKATAVVIGPTPEQAWRTQSLLSALQRTSGVLAPAMYGYELVDDRRYEAMVTGVTGPVVLLVDTEWAVVVAQQIQARHPDTIVEVVAIGG